MALTKNTNAILNLCSTLHDDKATSLQIKINKYLQDATEAELVFLARVAEQDEQLVVQVMGTSVLDHEVRFPINSHILSPAVNDKRTLILSELEEERREDLTALLPNTPQDFLCVPISRSQDNSVALLVCLVDKVDGFTEEDIDIVHECFQYTVGILLNTIAFEEERRLKIQCQSLLTVAKNLFRHLENVTLLLKEIMTEARNLTKAERCSLFLVDKERSELVAKVFDGIAADESACECNQEIRIPMHQGVVGCVATTGKLLNIRDAYSHPLFYKGIDQSTGFKTRNILCFPIKDDKGLIGVAELCNKLGGLCFNKFDEEIAKAFSIYCGLSIMHSLMFRKVRDAQFRSKLSNELMMYHMQVFQDEVTSLAGMNIRPLQDEHPEYLMFSFLPRSLPDKETPALIIGMISDLGFMESLHVPRDTLTKFVLMVRKGYRDPPYHNWMHAFSVTHFCYLLLKRLKLIENEYLTNLEALALFVACMCHDLDHRGTTNSFQLASNSVLAALYSSEGSVMERHHFSQAMCILNTEGCNIFEGFTEKSYTRSLDMLRDIILATDLAHHLRILGDLRQMIKNGYDKTNPEHHRLLVCLLMTSCDISDQTKNWKSTRKIADLVYREFFSQGDLEKAMGKDPNEMMDREKAFIPALQLQFLDDIVLPVYEMVAELFSGAQEPLETVRKNRLLWQRAQEVIRAKSKEVTSSLDILDDESVEKEVLGSPIHIP